MGKKIIYVDMDGVIADFSSSCADAEMDDPPEMFEKGFYRNLKVMPGAKEGVQRLIDLGFDVYIASKPTTKNLYSATEKYEWIQEHFPMLLRKIFLTCDKSHLNGNYLIDDYEKWGKTFNGIYLPFDEKNPEKSWNDIIYGFENEFPNTTLDNSLGARCKRWGIE